MTTYRALAILFIAGISVIGLMRPDIAAAQSISAEQRIEQADEEGGGVIYVPDTLERVVKLFPAAITAEIVDQAPLNFREITNRAGVSRGTIAEGVYKVRVTEVLYRKDDANAPALTPGTEIEVTQPLGRDDAKAFIGKKSDLNKKEHCLLFLWHPPGAARWTMVRGPFHFKQAPDKGRDALPMKPEKEIKYLTGRMAMTMTSKDDSVTLDWNSLVTEVKRVASLDPGPDKR